MLPLAALDFAAAGEHERAVQIFALAGLRRLAVVSDARFARAEDEFVGGRIADAARDGNAVFDHRDRNAEFRNALHEFAGAIERIDHPDAALVEASEIVDGLFREPALAGAQQVLLEDGVDRAIGLGDGIVSDLVFGLNCAGSKAVQDRPRLFQRGMNAFESFFGCSMKS